MDFAYKFDVIICNFCYEGNSDPHLNDQYLVQAFLGAHEQVCLTVNGRESGVSLSPSKPFVIETPVTESERFKMEVYQKGSCPLNLLATCIGDPIKRTFDCAFNHFVMSNPDWERNLHVYWVISRCNVEGLIPASIVKPFKLDMLNDLNENVGSIRGMLRLTLEGPALLMNPEVETACKLTGHCSSCAFFEKYGLMASGDGVQEQVANLDFFVQTAQCRCINNRPPTVPNGVNNEQISLLFTRELGMACRRLLIDETAVPINLPGLPEIRATYMPMLNEIRFQLAFLNNDEDEDDDEEEENDT